MNKSNSLHWAYIFSVFFLLYLPIIFLIIFSFNNSAYSFLWKGFTWKWYTAILNSSDLKMVALRSVITATLSATLATLIGLVSAISFYHYRFPGKKIILGLIMILILSPDIIIAVSLLSLYTLLNIPFGFLTLLIAHITFCLPFSVVTLYARLKGEAGDIVEAARDLGASEWVIFKSILVPFLMPAILVSWLLCFTLSLDDLIISFFVSGPEFEILPLRIFSLVRLGVKPELNALCAILFVITLFVASVVYFIQKKYTEG